MKRGDLLSVAVSGSYGKPRPAVVVQTDRVDGTDSILISLITSELGPIAPFRVAIPADSTTGLLKPSVIMADKTTLCLRDKCGPVFGKAPAEVMFELDRALTFILGLGT